MNAYILGKRIIALIILTGRLAIAAPFIPTADDQILERLPNAAQAKARDRLQLHLTRQPQSLNLTLQLAQQFIKQTRESGDPRYLGRAEALLTPWLNHSDPPVPVRVMRAILSQANHDFDSALTDLNAAIQRDPTHAQAWLTRSSIFQVRGDYTHAQQDCRELLRLQQKTVAEICLASIASLNGHAQHAYNLLAKIAAQQDAASATELIWLESLLADIAERLGDSQAAQRHYQTALDHLTRTGNKPELFLLTAFADYWLEQDRPQEVISLLESHQSADTALLRLAIATQRSHHPMASTYIQELQTRFAINRQRGSNLHLREEARFILSVFNRAEQALPLAEANWKIQREPIDARLLLETALAAGKPQAAHPVLTWLTATRLEDKRLQSLVKALSNTETFK